MNLRDHDAQVWLVTQGEFDGYEIIHVFNDEKTASNHVEQWKAAWPNSGSMERRVEAHEVLEEVPEMAVLCHAWWWESSGPEGEVKSNTVTVEVDEYADQVDRLEPGHNGDGFWCMSFHTGRAIQMVTDARAEILARL